MKALKTLSTDTERETLRELIERQTREFEAKSGPVKTQDIVRRGADFNAFSSFSKLDSEEGQPEEVKPVAPADFKIIPAWPEKKRGQEKVVTESAKAQKKKPDPEPKPKPKPEPKPEPKPVALAIKTKQPKPVLCIREQLCAINKEALALSRAIDRIEARIK